jgi:hypothetical protein
VKRTFLVIATLFVGVTLATPRAATAQDKPALVPLKVDLVVSRTAGAKKVSSLPYTLWMTANDKQMTSVRMGVQVPVTTTVFEKQGGGEPTRSWSYQNVGTNIDCEATTVGDGRYQLRIRLTDSSVDRDAPGSPTKDPNAGVPALRSFNSSFNILLKDGQTAQYASATDPVSGETLKVDVTLAVLK